MLRSVPPRVRKILVVDDDPDLRQAVAARITDLGAEAVEARDGQEGLARLSDGTPLPGAILLDVVPPRSGGGSLLQTLRSQPRLSRIPVLTLSRGHEPAPATPVARPAQAPFDVEEVARILVSLCDE